MIARFIKIFIIVELTSIITVVLMAALWLAVVSQSVFSLTLNTQVSIATQLAAPATILITLNALNIAVKSVKR